MSFVKKTWHNKGESVKTPISADGLNDLENRIEQAINNLKTATEENIDKEKYYKAGDTVNIAGYYTGIVTSSGTNILFTIFLPKLVSKTSGITLNCKNLAIRHADGGYIANDDGVFNDIVSSYATSYYIENRICMGLVLKTAVKFTNNSLVAVNFKDPTTITFK